MTPTPEGRDVEPFDPDYYNPDKVRGVITRVREAVRLHPFVARLGVEDIRTANPVRYDNLGEQGLYIATLKYLCDAWEHVAAAPRERTEGEPCSCAEWESGTKKLNDPIILAQARNPSLTGSPAFDFIPFKFCPWCGGAARTTTGRAARSATPTEGT